MLVRKVGFFVPIASSLVVRTVQGLPGTIKTVYFS